MLNIFAVMCASKLASYQPQETPILALLLYAL